MNGHKIVIIGMAIFFLLSIGAVNAEEVSTDQNITEPQTSEDQAVEDTDEQADTSTEQTTQEDSTQSSEEAAQEEQTDTTTQESTEEQSEQSEQAEENEQTTEQAEEVEQTSEQTENETTEQENVEEVSEEQEIVDENAQQEQTEEEPIFTGNVIQVPGNLFNLNDMIEKVKEMVGEIVSKIHLLLNNTNEPDNSFVLKQAIVNVDGKIAKCFGIKCEEMGTLVNVPFEKKASDPGFDVNITEDGNALNVNVDVNLNIIIDVNNDQAAQIEEALVAQGT
ncbi:MAG TPA: hypothetical protein VJG83_00775 [archaeon]|nr:hypothetical protein [archaeon]